jgi:hypothetical protein
MGIQLSNPNILDLTEWQKVINEINSISLRLDALTTGQGALPTAAVDWNGSAAFSQQFNIGNQKILFGKETIVMSNYTLNGRFYEGDISFSETLGISGFKAKPIVTASIVYPTSSMPTANSGVSMVLFNQSSTGFKFRLTNTLVSAGTLTGTFLINWIAIGPQG